MHLPDFFLFFYTATCVNIKEGKRQFPNSWFDSQIMAGNRFFFGSFSTFHPVSQDVLQYFLCKLAKQMDRKLSW